MEEKYKKAMVSNAQLDNDKANLIYQVDTLKDVIEEMEEQMAEMRREVDDKSKVKGSPSVVVSFRAGKPLKSLHSVIHCWCGKGRVWIQELERQKHTCMAPQDKL